MSSALAPITITGKQVQATVGGDPRTIVYVVVANTSLYMLECLMGSVDKWVLPFSADVIPVDGSTSTLTINPTPLGSDSEVITNQVFLTLYYASDQLNPGVYPQSVSSVAGDALGLSQAVNLVGLFSGTQLANGWNFDQQGGDSTELLVIEKPPWNVATFEGSLGAAAGSQIIAAGGATSSIFLRRIHACCDTIAPAGDVVVLHFGTSAGDASVGIVSGATAQAMPPQDLVFDGWNLGATGLALKNNQALFVTNAGTAGTVEVRVTVVYTQTPNKPFVYQ